MLHSLQQTGYTTFVKRKSDSVDPKFCLPLGINLCIGTGAKDEKVDQLPILMPDDELYPHVRAFVEKHRSKVEPILYIRPGDPICRYPDNDENKSTIALTMGGTKKGQWPLTTSFVSGEREPFPKEGVPKPPPVPRKRKSADEDDEKEPSTEDGSAKPPAKKKAKDSDGRCTFCRQNTLFVSKALLLLTQSLIIVVVNRKS